MVIADQLNPAPSSPEGVPCYEGKRRLIERCEPYRIGGHLYSRLSRADDAAWRAFAMYDLCRFSRTQTRPSRTSP